MRIAFMTDWGVRDGSVATCKAVIESISTVPLPVLDISHEVRDIKEGAFILGTSYQWFPEATIFLIVVDPGVGTNRRILIVKTEKYFFVAPDNGILSFLDDEEIKEVVSVENKQFFLQPVSSVFHGRDIFTPVAVYVATGIPIDEFGSLLETKEIKRISLFQNKECNNCLIGKVIFIDDFGNMVTSITRNDFDFTRKFKIQIRNKTINCLMEAFANGQLEEVIALFGGDFRWCSKDAGDDLMTIAVNMGSAAEIIGSKIGDPVLIKRY